MSRRGKGSMRMPRSQAGMLKTSVGNKLNTRRHVLPTFNVMTQTLRSANSARSGIEKNLNASRNTISTLGNKVQKLYADIGNSLSLVERLGPERKAKKKRQRSENDEDSSEYSDISTEKHKRQRQGDSSINWKRFKETLDNGIRAFDKCIQTEAKHVEQAREDMSKLTNKLKLLQQQTESLASEISQKSEHNDRMLRGWMRSQSDLEQTKSIHNIRDTNSKQVPGRILFSPLTTYDPDVAASNYIRTPRRNHLSVASLVEPPAGNPIRSKDNEKDKQKQ